MKRLWLLCEDGKYRDKYGNIRCPHGNRRIVCKECGGGGICKHGRQRWVCKECGGSCICEHGKVKSTCKACKGGSICEHDRERKSCTRCNPEANYKRYRRVAEKQDTHFNISLKHFKLSVAGSCTYCGESFKPMSCDRIDNTKGYVPGNIQPLCDMCNKMKLNHSEEEFHKHIQKIFTHLNLGKI